jgi:replicative DNA helicase
MWSHSYTGRRFSKKREEKIPFEGKAELIVAKQRNGPTDSMPLAFLKSYSRFENLAFEEY